LEIFYHILFTEFVRDTFFELPIKILVSEEQVFFMELSFGAEAELNIICDQTNLILKDFNFK
jgi:hypothetical protein